LSYIIPVEQQNTKLINAIFDRQTTFKDSLFYDISAWVLIWLLMLISEVNYLQQQGAKYEPVLKVGTINAKSNINLIEWTDHKSPKLLYQLLERITRKNNSATFYP
jgi:hypothetical protein